ncbi:hypothetical protein [Paenibacillus larvae]|uniref:hypothetical protein n=1 Tax=Paenibacillus larvae TaxID=1464 RepID=UPI00288EF188|nr:hypothetical protein [Paenibacillus larvae]MDT2282333.1 hypothetical protein [Paenibacillus larvae]
MHFTMILAITGKSAKVMTESERRMREFDDEYEEVSDRIAEGREGMKRGKRLYDR